ncbi:hypothetical protein DB347_01355 [Opitutaceae bacterium EW11]|nr:hypothetical protein DB347_01355 [Opitutaceae bacterium EW11]
MMILAICLLQISLSERTSEWRIVAFDWGPWLLVAPVVIWLSSRWPIEQRTWKWTLPVHIVLSLVVTASLGALAWQAFPMRVGAVRVMHDFPAAPPHEMVPPASGTRGSPAPALQAPGPSPEEFRPAPPKMGAPDTLQQRRIFPPRRAPLLIMVFTRGRGSVFFYWALLAMTHAVTYHRRSVAREKRALAAEARLAEARLTALQAQLQPHFLFNTLNTISALVYDKPAAADEMICSLSELLRRVLAASTRREVTLAEELGMARSYAAIQRVRFSDILTLKWDVPDELGGAAVPTLLLQPLVENAIVHAVERQNCPCTIAISARRKDACLALEVANTGNGSATDETDDDKRKGIGLSNTRARLTELYGNDHVFQFALDASGGATVHIEVPYRILASKHENSDRR